jgi:hypothetical protein
LVFHALTPAVSNSNTQAERSEGATTTASAGSGGVDDRDFGLVPDFHWLALVCRRQC